MHKLRVLSALGFLVCVAAPPASAQTFNANETYRSNELNPLTETSSTFGQFSVGYGLNFGDFTPFTAAEHDNAFAASPDTQGFHIFNNASVPAVVINVGPAPAFSGLNPGEMLLHPGGITQSAFDPPFYNGVLRFTAPDPGFYTITGNFRSLAAGITQNNILLTDASNTTTSVVSILDAGTFDLTLQLAQNDRIDFATGAAGDGIGSDSTGLTATLVRSTTPPVTPTRVNIDFNGKRLGDADSAGTYVGAGAAGGGNTFNGLVADSTADDIPADNLTVSASGLLNDQGQPTNVAFTVGPVGGDHEPTQPNEPAALYDDYVFNNSARNMQPTGSPFSITGLDGATTADLYLYTGFNSGLFTVDGALPGVPGTYNGFSAVFFDNAPVTNGTLTGVMGPDGRTAVLSGLTVEFVPEPGSALLVALGGGSLLLRRRKR